MPVLKVVLRWSLNDTIASANLRGAGRAFHSVGATASKAHHEFKGESEGLTLFWRLYLRWRPVEYG